MERIKGIGSSDGIAVGKVVRIRRNYAGLNRQVRTPDLELSLVRSAAIAAQEELQTLIDKTSNKEDADIFLFQQVLLNDQGLICEVENYIRAGAGAAAAVERASDISAARIRNLDDPYMCERACDIKDACRRVVNILDGRRENTIQLDGPCILAAAELYPSDLLSLDRSLLLGFITAQGSANAHASILARTYGFPAVVMAGADFLSQCDGRMGILDGTAGTLVLDPSADLLLRSRKKQMAEQAKAAALRKLIGKETVSKDGVHISLYANTAQLDQLQLAFANGAEGIGLYRTEFLYMEKEAHPAEDTLFADYRDALIDAAGRPVVMRTADLGSDKSIGYLNIPHEDNPALGYRGIRIHLREPALFHTQLRALLRASAYGELSILLPLITTAQEVLDAVAAINNARRELLAEGVQVKADIPLGVMIETPAAIMCTDILARMPEISFFSIGTNDLTQYTLAVDRTNGLIGDMYDEHHPAILRMIASAVHVAHAYGKEVCICGECAADATLTPLFLALGIDKLSVAPAQLLPLRKAIRSMDVGQNTEKALAEMQLSDEGLGVFVQNLFYLQESNQKAQQQATEKATQKTAKKTTEKTTPKTAKKTTKKIAKS